ncbi:hypothetical protein [Mycolicibacterium obuense]|uniref:Uncharacterized protein n=1 Tax=Mycolicibacterium obuense TaxID=1807 RepID=A0A0J6W854_9MYCO|nr:hypothetical protein [Mycolicibacterium obuense]KMO79425.1 hypothetical protein MOBUDSM44075_01225 [Mycolicibacterium obuense]
MPHLTIDSIDWDQSGGGLPYAIPELQSQLPVSGRVARQIPGPDRSDYFFVVLNPPLRFHPQPDFDWSRTQPEFHGRDDAGAFLRIYAVIVCSLAVGTQLHNGMRRFPVQLALVIDNTVGRDEHLTFEKCEYAGQALVSDVPSPSNSIELTKLADSPWEWTLYEASDGSFVLRVMFSEGPYKIDVGRYFLMQGGLRPDDPADIAARIKRDYPTVDFTEISKSTVAHTVDGGPASTKGPV